MRYLAHRGQETHAMAWGMVDAGVFDPDCPAITKLRYMACTVQTIHLHDTFLLLRALREENPDRADVLAENLWLAAEAGDSYGEWLWEWCEVHGVDPEATRIYAEADGKALAAKDREQQPGSPRTPAPDQARWIDDGIQVLCAAHGEVVCGECSDG